METRTNSPVKLPRIPADGNQPLNAQREAFFFVVSIYSDQDSSYFVKAGDLLRRFAPTTYQKTENWATLESLVRFTVKDLVHCFQLAGFHHAPFCPK